MGKFEFRKHGILLDIEGVQVTVPLRWNMQKGWRTQARK